MEAAGAVLVHTISHLAVAGTIAWLVYDCIGLAVLRRSWFNVDLVWSFSLLMGGGLLLLMMAVPPGYWVLGSATGNQAWRDGDCAPWRFRIGCLDALLSAV
jgi:hypothetical protein